MSVTPVAVNDTVVPVVNAAREILAEMGLHLDICSSGTRLIARRRSGRYLLTVYVENDCYVLFRKGQTLGSDKIAGRFPIADPACYDQMCATIRREINR